MMIVKASPDSEAGVVPSERLLAEMGAFNEELARRACCSRPSACTRARRVLASASRRTAGGPWSRRPFARPAELIAGFWLILANSRQEVIDWALRCPCPQESGEGEIEIPQVFEAEDFGQEFAPELRAKEERLRAELADKR